ncbi:hypothetical protein ACIBF1_19385 [Spirillospora sp. NPDC050679]
MPTSDTATAPLTASSCVEALGTLEPKTYDCVQSNLALLANAARGPGASVRLGRELSIVPRALPDGLATVDPAPEDEVARCARLLSLTGEAEDGTVQADALPALAAETVCYAIGDAYDMPWLPYAGRAHMPHSFLVARNDGATALVVDAYDNQTEWGPAEPGAWRIPWADLPSSLRVWRWHVPVEGPPPPTRVERQGIGPYLAAFRDHPDRGRVWEQLTVETWLLARRHALFARAHDHLPAAGDAQDRWQRLAADVFLGCRRVRRGRPEPRGALDDLEHLLTEPIAEPE